jgi:hypothetical protein
VSTQGLTYPHDFDPSQIVHGLLRRINAKFANERKSLISLSSFPCRESGQDVGKQATASVWRLPGSLLHKVTHSSGGKSQKRRRIMNLERLVEAPRQALHVARPPCR